MLVLVFILIYGGIRLGLDHIITQWRIWMSHWISLFDTRPYKGLQADSENFNPWEVL